MSDWILLSIPAFIVLMLVEWRFGVRRARATGRAGEQNYAPKDTAASLSMGIGNVLISAALKGAKLGLFFWLYERRWFDIGHGAWAWLALLVADDFVYYWYHRASHEVRFLWAAHVNHHSSERYNLATALRQSWTGPITHLGFYWVLPLLGFHPLMILTVGAVSLLYQFWIHTEHLDRLPRWFEAVFNTPSHHRVHHGTNVEYLDRNHGGILILWDRLFGTFEPEAAPVRYGLTKNLTSFNPIVIAFHEWAAIARDLTVARSWRERLGYVFAPPGWSPDGSTRTARELRAELSPFARAA